jgi:hypothetical protein
VTIHGPHSALHQPVPVYTVSGLRRRYEDIVECEHPRPHFRELGSVLLLPFHEGCIIPSWAYQTLPWVDDDALGHIDNITLMVWTMEGKLPDRDTEEENDGNT